MDALRAEDSSLEVDHRKGNVTIKVDTAAGIVDVSLSLVQASQLVALLHKHISEAAVEKLRQA
jgi:hypothetical protein